MCFVVTEIFENFSNISSQGTGFEPSSFLKLSNNHVRSQTTPPAIRNYMSKFYLRTYTLVHEMQIISARRDVLLLDRKSKGHVGKVDRNKS